jgi:hypothetical protein
MPAKSMPPCAAAGRLDAPAHQHPAHHSAPARVSRLYSLSALILPNGALFFCDTHVNVDPKRRADRRDDLAGGQDACAASAGAQGRPSVPFQLRHSHSPSAIKMRKALPLLAPPSRISRSTAKCMPMRPERILRARSVSNSP